MQRKYTGKVLVDRHDTAGEADVPSSTQFVVNSAIDLPLRLSRTSSDRHVLTSRIRGWLRFACALEFDSSTMMSEKAHFKSRHLKICPTCFVSFNATQVGPGSPFACPSCGETLRYAYQHV